jgi:hypothetical protein
VSGTGYDADWVLVLTQLAHVTYISQATFVLHLFRLETSGRVGIVVRPDSTAHR